MQGSALPLGRAAPLAFTCSTPTGFKLLEIPIAFIFLAALTSRSCSALHAGQTHCLCLNVKSLFIAECIRAGLVPESFFDII